MTTSRDKRSVYQNIDSTLSLQSKVSPGPACSLPKNAHRNNNNKARVTAIATAQRQQQQQRHKNSPGTIIVMMSHCRTSAPPVLAISLVFAPLPFFSTATWFGHVAISSHVRWVCQPMNRVSHHVHTIALNKHWSGKSLETEICQKYFRGDTKRRGVA